MIDVVAPKPPRGLMRGGVSTLQYSGVVVLVMPLVLRVLVLSSTFGCDLSSRFGFEHPAVKKCCIVVNVWSLDAEK